MAQIYVVEVRELTRLAVNLGDVDVNVHQVGRPFATVSSVSSAPVPSTTKHSTSIAAATITTTALATTTALLTAALFTDAASIAAISTTLSSVQWAIIDSVGHIGWTIINSRTVGHVRRCLL